jgi:hypothetical protein
MSPPTEKLLKKKEKKKIQKALCCHKLPQVS